MYKTLAVTLRASCAGGALLFAHPGTGVAAQPAARVAPAMALDIPAQPLSDAIRILSRRTGMELLSEPGITAGRRSRAIRGTMSPHVALERMLEGTDVGIRFDGNGSAILVRRPASVSPAAVTTAAAVAAASSAQPDLADFGGEDIVVTGSYADSVASALQRKRRADNVMDSIEAVDIADFPSQNVAEALQRVPGVTIERDRGVGLFVKVRGLGPHFQVTLLNGRSIAVNENVRDSGQSGRQFRFDTIPSELIAGIDVIKSPSAELEEGAIGGIVNLRTFKPLDLDSGTIALSGSLSHSELADAVDPALSGLASWKNDDETFGVLIAAAYAENTLRQDRITGVGWELEEDGIDSNGDDVADTGPLVVPTAVRPTFEQEDRARISVNAMIQYAPVEGVDLALEGFFTRLTDKYDELTYSADVNLDTIVPGSAVVEDGTLVGATSQATTQIGRDISEMVHDNWFVGLSGDIAAGAWTISPDLYVTRAESNTDSPITRTRLLGPSGLTRVTMPRSGGGRVPDVDFLEADLNDPGLLPFRRIEWRTLRSVDDEHGIGFSMRRPVEFGPVSGIRFGAKYRDRNREYTRRDLRFASLAGQFFDASYFNSLPVDDFLSDATGNLPRSWLQPDPDPFWIASDTSALGGEPTRGDLRNSYEIGETITSGYAMATLDTMLGRLPMRGNLGVRLSHTRQVSSGHADDGTAARPVRYESDYFDILPSMNLVFEPADGLIARVAAARVITRPSLADLAPRLTLNSSGTIFEARGGNPELERFQAWQYDATLEYYFGRSSALIAGIFYKDIGTFVYNQVTDFVVDGITYDLTAPTNGGDASVFGVELAYQQLLDFLPAPFDGLGIQANYTYADTQATYSETLKDDLQNVARHSFNLTGFYERGPFAARASYSWRGDVLQAVGTNDFLSINDKAFGSLDGSISLEVAEGAQIAVEGINLLDEAQENFIAGNWFGGYTLYGRTLRLTARIGF